MIVYFMSNNSIYIDPIYIGEPDGEVLRGRFRGVYHVCHPAANFSDGQILQGGGDYAGKTFMVVKWIGNVSNAYLAVETSATVETN